MFIIFIYIINLDEKGNVFDIFERITDYSSRNVTSSQPPEWVKIIILIVWTKLIHPIIVMIFRSFNNNDSMKSSKHSDGNFQPTRINPIHRIIPNVHIQIRLPACPADGVFRGPSPYLGIVIASSEPHQPRVLVVQPSGEAEGLEAGVRVRNYVTPCSIIDPLCDVTRLHVHNEAHGA